MHMRCTLSLGYIRPSSGTIVVTLRPGRVFNTVLGADDSVTGAGRTQSMTWGAFAVCGNHTSIQVRILSAGVTLAV
jgi:hypothetical protein